MNINFTIPGTPVAKGLGKRGPYQKQPYELRLQSANERLDSKLVPQGKCLIWTGLLGAKGYGRFRGPDNKKVFVHRFAYMRKHGSIPDGLVIDHLCRNRACCNPDHLEAVTNEENLRRGEVGSTNRQKTHCPQGHEYTPENTYTCSKGKRQCIICKRLNNRIYDQKRGWKRGIKK
ncbi:MAG: HNH endonuclease [Burkholderiaceae bacterium]|nr:HNH endonuclease [Burkholderiaceae bacterium]